MEIASWLTLISILIAIYAFFPKEELHLILLKVLKIEYWGALGIFIFAIPYLIFFKSLTERFTFLKIFTVSWGFDSSYLAFVLFYILFLWFLFRVVWLKPNKTANQKIIKFYLDLLSEISFEKFFKIFRKYERIQNIQNNWELYQTVFYEPLFLKGIINQQPYYLLKFWDKFQFEKYFQTIFKLFLSNNESIYYSEIKEHRNSSELLKDQPFLIKILCETLSQSIDCGLIKLVSSIGNEHLHNEIKNKEYSIYNQSPIDLDHKPKGYNLPIYYHIQFINLMYYTAIQNKQDISTFSNRYNNMETIYSCWIENMKINIKTSKESADSEYPTNYHWLINEMLSNANSWLNLFNKDENFNAKSSYLNFIPKCIGPCLDELYKGFETDIFSKDYIKKRIHNNLLSFYFGYQTKNELRTPIEEYCIAKIPKQLIEPVFRNSMYACLAFNYNDFLKKDFSFPPTLRDRDIKVLKRLHEFLTKENLL